ncbi:hypothetical protein [Microbulbifer sp. PSTR4-B]|uniref:hypothetical protein n=1 Tax=unclassified Microbulbifer TaxID=2619833 RepID=UPI00403ACC4C
MPNMQGETTYLKNTGPESMCIFSADHQLLGTARKIQPHDSDAWRGLYRVSVHGGIAHGKITYASSWADLHL